ncbi:MAG: hypothetical protein H7841_02970, partial [Magnetospirillum sp. WYHS-4]
MQVVVARPTVDDLPRLDVSGRQMEIVVAGIADQGIGMGRSFDILDVRQAIGSGPATGGSLGQVDRHG